MNEEENNDDVQIHSLVRDMLNTRARKKIRQHGGLLTTESATKRVLREDREEIIGDVARQLRQGGLPLLADTYLKDDEISREHVLRGCKR